MIAEAQAASAHDEASLWSALRSKGGTRARERLFMHYAPLAEKIAWRCHIRSAGSTVELGDLKQWASTGLLEAIDAFDPDRGTPFSAYARRRIRGSVLDGLARASEFHEQLAARARWRKQRVETLAADATAASEDPLGRLADLAIGLAIGFMLEDTTLYQANEAEEKTPSAYESLAWKETRSAMAQSVAALPEQEKAVIRHHYGGELAFKEIASLMGVSGGRISQIHRSALTKLRRGLRRTDRFAV